jgi:hypothetical protein
MSETQPKSAIAALLEVLKNIPTVCLVAGAALAFWAGAALLRYRELNLSPAEGGWRIATFAFGVALAVAAVGLYLFERKTRPEETVKIPGPYPDREPYPFAIDAPKTIAVIEDGQQFQVMGISDQAEPKDFRVDLMYTGGSQGITPHHGKIERAGDGRRFIWKAMMHLPDMAEIRKEGTRNFAFYFVGPHAKGLVDTHKELCEHFGKDRPWPAIPSSRQTEIVQCSPSWEVKFNRVRWPNSACRPILDGVG